MSKAQYDSSMPVVEFTGAFDPSRAFAEKAAAAFNAACPVGSSVIIKHPDGYFATVTTGKAFVNAIQFGCVAMVPVEDSPDKLASVKGVRWAKSAPEGAEVSEDA